MDSAQSAAFRAGGLPVSDQGGGVLRRGGRDRPGRPGVLSAAADDLALARRLALTTGELLLERFGAAAQGVERKSTRTDLVSDADRDAEAAIVRALAAERPDDGLLAEEGAAHEGTSGRRWVVDPLDGTINFLFGIPAWAVSVAVEDGEGALAGVVHDPVRGETFSALRGQGARLGEDAIAVSERGRLDTALVATGFGYDAAQRARQAALLTEVLPRVRDIRRAGAAALDLCSVACGRVDGYYEHGLKPWDSAAGALIAAEAGAVIEPLEGPPAGLMAASPLIAGELLAIVSSGL